jgi:hypothetical protein
MIKCDKPSCKAKGRANLTTLLSKEKSPIDKIKPRKNKFSDTSTKHRSKFHYFAKKQTPNAEVVAISQHIKRIVQFELDV